MTPRVLITGPDWFGDLLPYCLAACHTLGLEARTFAVNEAPWLARTRRREGAAARLPWVGPKIAHRLARATRRRLEADVNARFAAAAREFAPDVILALISWRDPLRADTLAAAPGVKAAWLMDDPFLDDESVLPSLHAYDRVYAADPSWLVNVRLWTAAPAVELPSAADPVAYRPLDPPPNRSGVAFVGSSYGRLGVGLLRQNLLRPLARFGLRVYGDPGWTKVPGLADCYAGGPVDTAGANEAYNRAAVVVNVQHTQWRGGTSLRTFAIAAAGAFQLVDRRPGLETVFVPGEEVAAYSGAAELVELVSRYLVDAPAREKAARAARERVLRDHTYAHRVRQVLRDCGQRAGP